MFKKPFNLIIVFVVGIVIGVSGTLIFQYFKGPKQVINVIGQGVVEAAADQANISVSVTNSSWSQKQAEQDNKDETQKLKDKLIAMGIPESRITQSTYSIPTFSGGSDGKMMLPDAPVMMPGIAPINGVNTKTSATTNLTIVLDTLKGIDRVYTTINESPNAKLLSTNYSLKNSTPFEVKAREKALQDARNQAQSIADINKLKVGKLLSLNNNNYPVPMYKDASVGMMQGGAGQQSQSGISYSDKTIQVSVSYNVVYELY